MKRKFITIPEQLQYHTSVVGDLEQLVKHLKTGQHEILSTPFSESVISLIHNETLNRNPHLMIPMDVLKKIFMYLGPEFAIKTIRPLNKTFCNWVNRVTDHYAIEWSKFNRSNYGDCCIQHYAAWANAQKPFDLVWSKKLDFKLWHLQKQDATFKVTKNGQSLFGDFYYDNPNKEPYLRFRSNNRTEQNIVRLCDVIKIRWISASKTIIRDTKDAFADNNFYSMVVHIK